MVLKKEHFISVSTSTADKSTVIFDITNELNLTSDSIVFADDSDYEIGFVNLNLPNVTTVKIDYMSNKFIKTVSDIFKNIEPSSDLNRTRQYKEQKSREKEKLNFIKTEDYNKSLP